jgi:hypothetical protein
MSLPRENRSKIADRDVHNQLWRSSGKGSRSSFDADEAHP